MHPHFLAKFEKAKNCPPIKAGIHKRKESVILVEIFTIL